MRFIRGFPTISQPTLIIILLDQLLQSTYWTMHDHTGGEEFLLHFEDNFRRRLALETIEIEKCCNHHACNLLNGTSYSDELVKKLYAHSPSFEITEV